MNGKKLMVAIKDDQGNIITADRDKIFQKCAEFYKKLHSSTLGRPTTSSIHTDTVPSVSCSEVENALKYMSSGKAPGSDGGNRTHQRRWTSSMEKISSTIHQVHRNTNGTNGTKVP